MESVSWRIVDYPLIKNKKKGRRNESYLKGWEFMEAYIRIMTAHHPDDLNFQSASSQSESYEID